MTTKLALWILGAVVVVGGGGYYYFTHPSAGGAWAPSEEQTASSTAQGDTEQSGAYTGSIADLSARGGDWKCTVDAKATPGGAQALSSGTVYVSGKNVRGDFTTNVSGYGSVESHMIADGTNVYTWSGIMPFGVKTAMTASSEGGSQATSGQGASANQSYAYDCEPSQADASLFTVPAGVTFRAY